MEKCKFCQEELPEGATVCPSCGKDNAETETPVAETAEAPAAEAVEEAAPEVQNKKATPGKIALAVAVAVVLVGVLVALIVAGVKGKAPEAPAETSVAAEETVPATVPADGNPDDATCKGTYTVTDEEAKAAKDTVVATIGEHQLTNGLLQVHYWSAVNSFLSSQQGYYVMMYGGIDYTKPLDTQICVVNQDLTWQQHFLQQALTNWQTSVALAGEAEKAQMEMTQEEKDFLSDIETYLETTAASFNLTVDELLLRNVGPGAGMEEFKQYQQTFSEGRGYYAAELDKMVPTDEELETFYEAHAEEYAQGGVDKDGKFVNVRHILIMPKAGEEDVGEEFTEEQWAACEAEAQAALDAWLSGEKTEESFAALAGTWSEDPGSNQNGGLYENVYEGQMVEPFEKWCFDESRQSGDYGIVKTDYGFHVMYFVSSAEQWKYYAGNDWRTEQTNNLFDRLAADYPMEVEYGKVSIGHLELGQ